jgi:High potential iron-sulfur protein
MSKRPTETNRRVFMMTIAAAGGALAATGARAQAKLDEKDPQAVALGYVADTTKADKKKFPKHENTQACGNCQLFQGKATDAAGGCPLFAGKQVATKGWCSAWAKKAS